MLVAYEFPYTHAMQEIGAKGITNTRYPNLFGEWAASPYHLWVLCDHANVEEDIMKAVLYDGEELNLDEALGLDRLFEGTHHDEYYTLEYLFLEDLKMLYGSGLQDKAVDLIEVFNLIDEHKEQLDYFNKRRLNSEMLRIRRLCTSEIATYADYRRCKLELLELKEPLNIPKRRSTLLSEEDYI